MFVDNVSRKIDNKYFNLIKIVDSENFVEFQSRNTKDFWIIKRNLYFDDKFPIYIYHKHPNQGYYHHHWQCYSIKQAIDSIKQHDAYKLNIRLYK